MLQPRSARRYNFSLAKFEYFRAASQSNARINHWCHEIVLKVVRLSRKLTQDVYPVRIRYLAQDPAQRGLR